MGPGWTEWVTGRWVLRLCNLAPFSIFSLLPDSTKLEESQLHTVATMGQSASMPSLPSWICVHSNCETKQICSPLCCLLSHFEPQHWDKYLTHPCSGRPSTTCNKRVPVMCVLYHDLLEIIPSRNVARPEYLPNVRGRRGEREREIVSCIYIYHWPQLKEREYFLKQRFD